MKKVFIVLLVFSALVYSGEEPFIFKLRTITEYWRFGLCSESRLSHPILVHLSEEDCALPINDFFSDLLYKPKYSKSLYFRIGICASGNNEFIFDIYNGDDRNMELIQSYILENPNSEVTVFLHYLSYHPELLRYAKVFIVGAIALFRYWAFHNSFRYILG